MRKERVLVTGGVGYIGSVLVPMLLEKGCEVIVIDNFRYGQNWPFNGGGLPPGYRYLMKEDANNLDHWRYEFRMADWVFPLAGLIGAPICDKNPDEARATNLEAIQKILENRKPTQKIIFPTTNSGYGRGQSSLHCDENTPLTPVSLYGELKVEAEKILSTENNVIRLRLATAFGVSPRMRLDLLVNDFVHRALRDNYLVVYEGHFKRNYIHVRDIARAFLHCMDNFETMKNTVYNVGLSDANLSKLELCQKIKEYLPKLDIIEREVGKDPDQRNYIVSNAKIEATGYKPTHSLDFGIEELIEHLPTLKTNPYSNI